MGPYLGYAGALVFVSFCYLVLRRLLQLIALRMRSNELQEDGGCQRDELGHFAVAQKLRRDERIMIHWSRAAPLLAPDTTVRQAWAKSIGDLR